MLITLMCVSLSLHASLFFAEAKVSRPSVPGQMLDTVLHCPPFLSLRSLDCAENDADGV